MTGRKPSALMAIIILAAVGVSILLIISHILNHHPLGKPVPIPTIAPRVTYYGFLQCYGHLIVIPSNSIIMLNYRVRSNATIDFVGIYMAFPASIINEALTVFSRLSNPSDALIMSVYVNGKLIASTNDPGPIQGLEFAVNNSNGYIAVAYTDDDVSFPPINLTNGDVITVLIYSAVPYALPTCPVSNGGGGGAAIIEEPVIYITNVTRSMSQLPQVLTAGLITNAKPFTTNYAPSYVMGYEQLPQYVRTTSNG